jgi:GAF domain-containing protein
MVPSGLPPSGSGRWSGSTLGALCDRAVLAAHGDGAAVTEVLNGTQRGVVYSTGALALDIARLQSLLEEGPSIDAGRDGYPILVADISQDTDAAPQWLTFTAEASLLGAAAVFAFPLQVGAARVGVLTVHRGRSGGLDGPGMIMLLELADRLALALIDRMVSLEHDHAKGATRSMERDQEDYFQTSTHQATGMLAALLGVPLAEALAELRATAFAQARSVNEVADDVVARTLTFAVDGQGRITHDTHG